jgi:hypothetical protein
VSTNPSPMNHIDGMFNSKRLDESKKKIRKIEIKIQKFKPKEMEIVIPHLIIVILSGDLIYEHTPTKFTVQYRKLCSAPKWIL